MKKILTLCLILVLILGIGCSKNLSDKEKLEFLKKEFFYGVTYDEFMAITPNLQDLKTSNQIEDDMGHIFSEGTWSFKVGEKHFLIQNFTPNKKIDSVFMQMPYSKIRVKKIASKIDLFLKRKNKNEYIWEFRNKNIVGFYIDQLNQLIIFSIGD